MDRRYGAGGVGGWLLSLWKETWAKWLFLLSLPSTAITYLPQLGLARFRAFPVLALIAGFAWANYEVYRKQSANISDLASRLDDRSVPHAQIVVRPIGQSLYTLAPSVPNIRQIERVFALLDVIVENQGSEASVIDKFTLRAEALPAFIGPAPTVMVPGRHTQHAIAPDRTNWLREGFLRVPAGDARRISLIFHSGVPPTDPRFTEDATTRKYPGLRATLTLADTKGIAASIDLSLEEG